MLGRRWCGPRDEHAHRGPPPKFSGHRRRSVARVRTSTLIRTLLLLAVILCGACRRGDRTTPPLPEQTGKTSLADSPFPMTTLFIHGSTNNPGDQLIAALLPYPLTSVTPDQLSGIDLTTMALIVVSESVPDPGTDAGPNLGALLKSVRVPMVVMKPA